MSRGQSTMRTHHLQELPVFCCVAISLSFLPADPLFTFADCLRNSCLICQYSVAHFFSPSIALIAIERRQNSRRAEFRSNPFGPNGDPENDVLDPDPPVVDDLVLERQWDDTRNWDWKCGLVPHFGERKSSRADCICFRWFCPIEEDRIVLSIADDDELSGDKISPRCDLFEISLRQVGRVLFNEVLYQVCRRLVVQRVSGGRSSSV